ncbi:MAG: 16S rRNA (cytidine(1402)-2'-O)-methyltransferase [Chlamydiales bacterium]|nr:16S rRNA (cytidine(1402)-2'-O)-methyltransferase [Chlamydiales bacterium]
MLFIIATPIGNLKDFSFRAVETINTCDYLLCEDTRKTKVLMDHYGISKPLVSFHLFNEKKKIAPVIQDLQSGKNIALLSDAGTPLICDPGSFLVQAVKEADIPYFSIPGPSAVITALSLIGKPYKKWQFLGFFHDKANARKKQIEESIYYDGLSAFYVAPHDLLKILKEIHEIKADTSIMIFRELTKLFEEKKEGSVQEMLDYYTQHPPRGEIVLFIEGIPQEGSISLSEKQLMDMLVKEYGLKLPQAAKLTATLTGKNRKELYKEFS